MYSSVLIILCLLAANIPFFPTRRRRRFARSAEKRRLQAAKASGNLDTFLSRLATGSALSPGHDSAVRSRIDGKGAQENAQRRILIVCGHAPTTRHAGGLRILDIIQQIKVLDPTSYVEVFTSADHQQYGSLEEACRIADRVILSRDRELSLREYFKASSRGRYFDVIDFQFFQPLSIVAPYRKIGRKLVFTPMESQIRNEMVTRNGLISLESIVTDEALEEAAVCHIVDLTVCVSDLDRAAISKCVKANIITIETAVSEIEFNGIIEPENPHKLAVCYVAYFGSETNRAALGWYLNEVHPRVLSSVENYQFRIIGRGDISDILPNPHVGVSYLGEVDHIGPHICAAAIGIAPAFSGAGFRGKINQYAAMGLPCVATPIAADGLAYKDGSSIVIAESANEFAQKIVELLNDEATRLQIGEAARLICGNHYFWKSRAADIARVYNLD